MPINNNLQVQSLAMGEHLSAWYLDSFTRIEFICLSTDTNKK